MQISVVKEPAHNAETWKIDCGWKWILTKHIFVCTSITVIETTYTNLILMSVYLLMEKY